MDNRGLYPKYAVINVETSQEVDGVFVLKPEKDPHARIALATYAESVRAENPALARDLIEWLELIPVPPLLGSSS